jgi:ribosome-associated protein
MQHCQLLLFVAYNVKYNFLQEAYLPAKKNVTKERLILCVNAILQKKAKEIVVLNLKEVSAFTDYMIICSGTSEREVQAIAQAIQLFLKKAEIRPLGVEGESNGQWILLDYDDVVISVFHEPVRTFYNIENLWDSPRMNVDENKKEITRLSKGMA